MHGARRLLLASALAVSGVVAPVAAPAVCAQEGPRAVLVVDTGSQELEYCVGLDATSVSGLRLIQLANQQHGLQYRLGHGGGAVCQLAGVGPASGDCFSQYPDFWGYWRWDGAGWRWSGTGAGSSSVTDGSIEGWSWGSGQTGSSHPQPPVRSFEAVCGSPPQASTPPAGGGSSGGGSSGGGKGSNQPGDTSGGGSSGDGGTSADGTESDAPPTGDDGTQGSGGSPPAGSPGGGAGQGPPGGGSEQEDASTVPGTAPAPAGSPGEAVAASTARERPDGRAIEGLLAALVSMGALGGMGWIVIRARRRAA